MYEIVEILVACNRYEKKRKKKINDKGLVDLRKRLVLSSRIEKRKTQNILRRTFPEASRRIFLPLSCLSRAFSFRTGTTFSVLPFQPYHRNPARIIASHHVPFRSSRTSTHSLRRISQYSFLYFITLQTFSHSILNHFHASALFLFISILIVRRFIVNPSIIYR